MSLYLLDNALASVVKNDLRKIYPWPDLTFTPIAGTFSLIKVSVVSPPTPSTIATLISVLVSSPVEIAVAGEMSDMPMGNDSAGNPVPMSAVGGLIIPDRFPGPARINIFYDCEAGVGCRGRGRFAIGTNPDTTVDAPTDVVLYHELGHAYHFITNGFSGDPQSTGEADVLPLENEYRISRTPALGERAGHGGGCNSGPPSSTSPSEGSCKSCDKTSSGPGGCFIATAVLDSAFESRLESLRLFREEAVYATSRGADFLDRFYACYRMIGPRIAREMASDTSVRRTLIACAVIPVISYLTLAVGAPAELPRIQLAETWREFLENLQLDLQQWAIAAMPPLVPAPLGEEAFFVRYVLRTPAAKEAYAESVAEGRVTDALQQFARDADSDLCTALETILDHTPRAGAISEYGRLNPISDLLVSILLRELGTVKQVFAAGESDDVFRIAFSIPLRNFIRLSYAMPLGEIPTALSSDWRDILITLRSDRDALFEMAFTLLASGVLDGKPSH